MVKKLGSFEGFDCLDTIIVSTLVWEPANIEDLIIEWERNFFVVDENGDPVSFHSGNLVKDENVEV